MLHAVSMVFRQAALKKHAAANGRHGQTTLQRTTLPLDTHHFCCEDFTGLVAPHGVVPKGLLVWRAATQPQAVKRHDSGNYGSGGRGRVVRSRSRSQSTSRSRVGVE